MKMRSGSITLQGSLSLMVLVGITLVPSVTWVAAAAISLPHLPLEGLLVSDQGRVKPLATLAREQETLLGVTFPGDPVDGFVALALNPETSKAHVFLSLDAGLGRRIRVTDSRKISLADLVAKEADLKRIASSAGDPHAEEASGLLGTVRRLMSMEQTLTIAPASDPKHDWVSPERNGAPSWARESWMTLTALYQRSAWEEAAHEARALVAEQRREIGDLLPSRLRVAVELLWRRINPPRVLPWLAGGVFLLHLAGMLRFRIPQGLARVGTAFLTITMAVSLSAWIVMAGRLPLLNSWEVYFLVLFLLPFLGLFVEIRTGISLIGTVAVLLTFMGAIGLTYLPPVGNIIGPPVAILQSPWREVHIISTMTAYALLFLVTGISTVLLGKPENKRLHRIAHQTLLFGELLLGVGIATGAAWAHEAWGRYWGWDPKEVWALIAWLVFAAGLHARASGFVRVRGWAILNLVGFAALLFTFFGVTYLLPGLHSYG